MSGLTGFTFRRHLTAYVAVNFLLTGINLATGRPWWAFWPLMLWGLALMLHFFVHRASSVDEAWVEARAEDLRSKSYDASHIDDIRAQPTPSMREKQPDPGKR